MMRVVWDDGSLHHSRIELEDFNPQKEGIEACVDDLAANEETPIVLPLQF